VNATRISKLLENISCSAY